MQMSNQCKYCINKNQCQECSRTDKFIPCDEVKHYFTKMYTGIGGINGYKYSWNSTNESLMPTSHIDVNGYDHYCPYCGEKMFPIQGLLAQGINDYTTTGYCCICQGARDEIEYERKLKDMKKQHARELAKLKIQYHKKLQFCSEKLIDIRIATIKEKQKRMPTECSYFSTLNGEKISSVTQLIDF